MPHWWVGWEPNCLLLKPSPSVLTYYSGLNLCWSKSEKAHIWRIAITESLVLALDSLLAAAHHGVIMSKTAYPRTISGNLGIVMPIHDCLTRWIDDLVLLPSVCKSGLDLVLTFVALCGGQEVDGSCVSLKIHSSCIDDVRRGWSALQTNVSTTVSRSWQSFQLSWKSPYVYRTLFSVCCSAEQLWLCCHSNSGVPCWRALGFFFLCRSRIGYDGGWWKQRWPGLPRYAFAPVFRLWIASYDSLYHRVLDQLHGVTCPENCLDVFILVECSLRDWFRFMELGQGLTNKWAVVELGTVHARHLEDLVRAAKETSEALRAVRACVDKLIADRALSTARTEQAKTEPETLAVIVHEL